jgi:adenosine deaminase
MILVCTLGLTWQVIPEAYALLDGGRCPLYRLHPPGPDLRLAPPDELWVVTTAGTDPAPVERWWQALGAPVPLRLFRTAASDGQAQDEVELTRELIQRVVLAAGPDCVVCLSGGRKTMSADLQRAAIAFGCQALLHVLPTEGADQAAAAAIRQRLEAHDWTTPLPADLPVRAVLVGRGQPSDLLAIAPAIAAARFPAAPGTFAGPGPEGWLWRSLDERERDGGRVLASYRHQLATSEHHENWRSLYRLPPAQIDRLRTAVLGPADRPWLVALPKAELHCHIGGALDLDDQRVVGAALRADGIDDDITRALALPAAELEARLWDPAITRVALASLLGFPAYERPGELSGCSPRAGG